MTHRTIIRAQVTRPRQKAGNFQRNWCFPRQESGPKTEFQMARWTVAPLYIPPLEHSRIGSKERALAILAPIQNSFTRSGGWPGGHGEERIEIYSSLYIFFEYSDSWREIFRGCGMGWEMYGLASTTAENYLIPLFSPFISSF